MSLRELNAHTRRRLRWHGWLLTLWCLAIGLLGSWLLLRVFGVRVPAARYAMSAVLMYALGLVFGTWYWLRHFASSVREEAGALGRADGLDRMMQANPSSLASRGVRRMGDGLDWGDLLGSAADLFSFDEAAWLLILPALIVFALGALMLAGALPMLIADGVAGMLAEIALQFVFGALIARRVLRPQAPDDAFMHIVGKTWIAGLGLVVVSAVAGWLLTQLAPQAASVGDLFR
jgi:hypothetical protein